MTLSAVLYSDPNCPFCYAMGERLIRLGVESQIEWRGVQHAPMLPIPRQERHPRVMSAIESEVRAVQRLAPEVPIIVPSGKPNTAPAIRTLAAAAQVDAARAQRLRRDLYRALWQQNEDISSPEILSAYAQKHGFEDVTRTPAHEARLSDWTRAWEACEVGSVPLLVRSDGALLSGLVTDARLVEFLHISIQEGVAV